MDKKPAIKRNREKRNNKRWTDNEIKQLLQYLQEQPDFEKPTAQIFYRQFLKASNLDATWDLCRWKIKNLRTTYKKAETWRRSNGLFETDPAVQDKLRKICRFYDDLHCVFAQRFSDFPDELFDSASTTDMSFNRTSLTESTMDDSIDEFHLAAVKSEANDDIEEQTPLLVPLRSETTSPVSSVPAEPQDDERVINHKDENVQLKPDAFKNSLDEISQKNREQSTFLKMRLEFEKDRFQKEFELKERKFAEEIKERREKFELKKLEMEQEKHLRILQLEKEERIETFEIKMRYRRSRSRSRSSD
ncbi:uncharacterized protein LOC135949581 [Calliphora vicina]|uniref:uncharacterized protein LOC135949581 n=1 Tax=Calliphora vicina TaxID=7373 RepID=UPI00325B53E4